MVHSSNDVGRRLEELLARAQAMSGRRPDDSGIASVTVAKSELWRFLISSLQTVASACGKDSPHIRELERARDRFVETNDLDMDSCTGVLQATRDDLAAGMLASVRQLVTAEAFGDLLDAAAHLLDEQHHLPAVALTGAVLESSLRAAATFRGVSLAGHSSISKLNAELYRLGAHDKVQFAEIEAWARLRNKVDHGDFASPADIDVGAARRMLDGVRAAVSSQLRSTGAGTR